MTAPIDISPEAVEQLATEIDLEEDVVTADVLRALRTALTASEKSLAVANKLWKLCIDEGWPWAAGEVQDALEEMGLLYPKDMTTEDCGEQCENCSGDCDRCLRAVESVEDVK